MEGEVNEEEGPLPPGWTSYKPTRFKPTPEQVAMVRRWVAEQDAVLKERLRQGRLRKENPPRP
jgi:hypothetical protein